jgi:hypothetical protein
MKTPGGAVLTPGASGGLVKRLPELPSPSIQACLLLKISAAEK